MLSEIVGYMPLHWSLRPGNEWLKQSREKPMVFFIFFLKIKSKLPSHWTRPGWHVEGKGKWLLVSLGRFYSRLVVLVEGTPHSVIAMPRRLHTRKSLAHVQGSPTGPLSPHIARTEWPTHSVSVLWRAYASAGPGVMRLPYVIHMTLLDTKDLSSLAPRLCWTWTRTGQHTAYGSSWFADWLQARGWQKVPKLLFLPSTASSSKTVDISPIEYQVKMILSTSSLGILKELPNFP